MRLTVDIADEEWDRMRSELAIAGGSATTRAAEAEVVQHTLLGESRMPVNVDLIGIEAAQAEGITTNKPVLRIWRNVGV